jgi:hypothetical protein
MHSKPHAIPRYIPEQTPGHKLHGRKYNTQLITMILRISLH